MTRTVTHVTPVGLKVKPKMQTNGDIPTPSLLKRLWDGIAESGARSQKIEHGPSNLVDNNVFVGVL